VEELWQKTPSRGALAPGQIAVLHSRGGPAACGRRSVHKELPHTRGVWSDDIVDQAKAAGAKPDAVLEPWARYVSEHFGHKPARALHDALDYFAELSRRFDVFFQRYDLMLSPVLHSEAPPLGYLGPQTPVEVMVKRLHRYASYTPVHNAAGVPAMSVPLGLSPSGLPIGSHFASRRGNERMLFELAYELEQSAPWAGRWPG
jgi:amidase